MNILQEFKTFAVKGNVVDMAVGIIIGAAFGKIVSSLVGDVVLPPIGLLIGGSTFADLALTLKAASGSAPAVTLNYGRFIQTVLDFTILAFAVFLMVKGINSSNATNRRPRSLHPPCPRKRPCLPKSGTC